jgi:hypothetical protein
MCQRISCFKKQQWKFQEKQRIIVFGKNKESVINIRKSLKIFPSFINVAVVSSSSECDKQSGRLGQF